MISSVFLIKIIVVKLILSLGYSGFLVYQPIIFSEPPQLSEIVRQQIKSSGTDENIGKKNLPLSKERIKPQPRLKENTVSFASKLSAQSYLVVDSNTENILLGNLEEEVRSIGSLTKLMTALVFLENNPQWEKEMIIDKNDGKQGKLYIFDGEKVKVRDLFFASLVGSSNNATVALVRSSEMSLEDFVDKMNQKARELGFKNTSFSEPTGLSFLNRSTAKEVALLLKYSLQQELIKEAVVTKSYDITVIGYNDKQIKRRVENTDILLSSDFKNSPIEMILGAKTGFIDEAGYCFAMETKDKEGRDIITVVLGSETHFSRFSEAQVLAEWTYKNYLWPGQEGFDKLTQE